MYLETRNCTIRNFLPSDVEELYETLSDSEVMEYIEPPFTLEQTFSLIEFSKNNGVESLILECSPRQTVTKHIAEKFHFRYEGMQDECEVYRLNLME